MTALLSRLGLQPGDAGVLLGVFLAGDGDDVSAAALERLEAPWAERCQAALAEIRALEEGQRKAVLRALSQTLLIPEAPKVASDRLAVRLREVHPQVAAAMLSMVPTELARRVTPSDAETCRLPAALRVRIAWAELRRLEREEREEQRP